MKTPPSLPEVDYSLPDKIGITLVPLEIIEQMESSFFWSSLFLSITTSIFGGLISYLLSPGLHYGVLCLLVTFGSIFIILTMVFANTGFKKRKKAREMAIGTRELSKNDPAVIKYADMGQGDAGVGAAIEIMEVLKKIFGNESKLPKEKLVKLMAPIFSNTDLENFVMKLVQHGLIQLEHLESGEVIVNINSEFDPVSLKGKFNIKS